MLKQLKAWWAAESVMVQLRGQSDRMLADMGLKREGLREQVYALSEARVAKQSGSSAMACECC